MTEKKRGLVERGAGFFEKLHYGLGAIALAGSFIASERLAVPLVVFGTWEVVHGGLWTAVKKWRAGKRQPAPA